MIAVCVLRHRLPVAVPLLRFCSLTAVSGMCFALHCDAYVCVPGARGGCGLRAAAIAEM